MTSAGDVDAGQLRRRHRRPTPPSGPVTPPTKAPTAADQEAAAAKKALPLRRKAAAAKKAAAATETAAAKKAAAAKGLPLRRRLPLQLPLRRGCRCEERLPGRRRPAPAAPARPRQVHRLRNELGAALSGRPGRRPLGILDLGRDDRKARGLQVGLATVALVAVTWVGGATAHVAETTIVAPSQALTALLSPAGVHRTRQEARGRAAAVGRRSDSSHARTNRAAGDRARDRSRRRRMAASDCPERPNGRQTGSSSARRLSRRRRGASWCTPRRDGSSSIGAATRCEPSKQSWASRRHRRRAASSSSKRRLR